MQRINQRFCYVSTLPQKQQILLKKYLSFLNSTKECVESNARVIDKMLSNVDNLFINSSTKSSNIEPEESGFLLDPDSDKVHITLKQIVRDWTDEGADERNPAYKLIIGEIMSHFNVADMQKNQFKVVSADKFIS